MILSSASNSWSVLLNDEVLALIAYVLLYLIYYFGSDFKFVKKWRSSYGETPDNFERSVYFRRTMGFILLGILPIVLIVSTFDRPLINYGLSFPSGPYAWIWFLAPTVVIVAVSILRPSKGIDTSYYPEVRKASWPRYRHIINGLFWALYLLGYEFGLRGMVFFSLIYAFGLWPAVIITSVIYSLIHIFKGPQEAFGAFFLGVLFCLITYFTNSFWIAFVIHTAMAIINDEKAWSANKKR